LAYLFSYNGLGTEHCGAAEDKVEDFLGNLETLIDDCQAHSVATNEKGGIA